MQHSKQLTALTLVDAAVMSAIAGAFALTLLPVFAAAQARAQRAACMSNLNFISTGLRAYAADYGGYLPSSPAVLGPEQSWCRNRADLPVTDDSCILDETHRRAGEAFMQKPLMSSGMTYRFSPQDVPIRVIPSNDIGMLVLSSFRTIGFAANNMDGQNPLKLAPNGLGMILTHDYLPDARTLYCPAAPGMPGPNDYWMQGQAGAYNLEHWKQAGGYDGKSLLYGNWTTAKWHPSFDGAMISSHYAYRNVIVDAHNPWHWYQQDDPAISGITGTRPVVSANIGSPMFLTAKYLSGRAIVVDAFDKGTSVSNKRKDYLCTDPLGRPWPVERDIHIPGEESKLFAGMGIKGHRDAYNVLYGDGHAAEYADPEEKMIWHMQSFSYGGEDAKDTIMAFCPQITGGSAGALAYTKRDASGSSSPYRINTSNAIPGAEVENIKFTGSFLEVWHEFDAAAEIDVE